MNEFFYLIINNKIFNIMTEQRKNIFHPIISSIQKIALYETKSHFYLMGSNNTLTRFRVLKIDRMEPRELILMDDKIEYTQDEIRDLVKMIDMGNRNKANQRGNASGVTKVVSAFGIIGFICFLEGYYIILVTKRRRIAIIGNHTIYKIEDTSMIYIPNDSVRFFHPDEQRYVKMFQSIDLSSNFYFSYSYDLTHTLQSNMALPKHVHTEISAANINNELNYQNHNSDCSKMWKFYNFQKNRYGDKVVNYGIRTNPHRRFIWNSHLLSSIEKNLHRDWILHIIHGFVGQSNVSVFGRSIYITIIARRSSKYAGTRFLKRGANFEGDVANEVETEQIVHDSNVSSLKNGHFSSFVQMRGSVPGHWSQDISKMVPKPTITIDLCDPFVETAGAHFNELFKRYGSPIIILNLVKKREKKKHESTLSEEMNIAVKYLNQFLPSEHNIQYISFDMARKNKGRKTNVMEQLATIANNAVLKTGIFQSLYLSYNKNHIFNTKKLHKLKDSSLFLLNDFSDIFESTNLSMTFNDSFNYCLINDEVKQYFIKKGSLQTGIIRTNCVDCLDRTNTAQFSIGKCALGYQLYALGILNSPKLEFDTDCVRMLEELYEDHGDTLALQYGGSQLVHRIKTYRKTAPWTSQGNDIMQTLSRYYSNTFSDQEKQQTINLFLGLFIPEEGKPPIWELLTDYYIHHKPACKYVKKSKILTQWWDKSVLKCLPYSFFELTKTCTEIIEVQCNQEEIIDIYYDYYRPFELSLLTEVYSYQVSHSVRDFMPHFTTNFSPFVVRVRPGRRREESTNKNANIKNPSLTGHSGTSSTASSTSSSLSSSSDDNDSQCINNSKILVSKYNTEILFKTLFPSMRKVYGAQPDYPKRTDTLTYKRFVLIGKNAIYKLDSKFQYKFLPCIEYKNVEQFTITTNTINIYEDYLKKSKYGGSIPNSNDLNLYEQYSHQQLHLGVLQPDLP